MKSSYETEVSLSDTFNLIKTLTEINFFKTRHTGIVNILKIDKHAARNQVAKIFIILNQEGLLTDNNTAQYIFDIIMNLNHEQLYNIHNILLALKGNNFFIGKPVKAGFNAIVAHHNPRDLIYALAHVRKKLLTPDITQPVCNAIVSAQDPKAFATTLDVLYIASQKDTYPDDSVINLDNVKNTLSDLVRENLLTEEMSESIFSHLVTVENRQQLEDTLFPFIAEKHLTPDTTSVILEAATTQSLIHRIIAILRRATLLINDAAEQPNFHAIVTHRNPQGVVTALSLLLQADLLKSPTAQLIFNEILSAQSPEETAKTLVDLNVALEIATDEAPKNLFQVMNTLYSIGVFQCETAQANFHALIAHKNQLIILQLIHRLNLKGLLHGNKTQDIFNLVILHQNPEDVIDLIDILDSIELLNRTISPLDKQINFNSIITHQNPKGLANACYVLLVENLLAGDTKQAIFNDLVAADNPGEFAKSLLLDSNADEQKESESNKPLRTSISAPVSFFNSTLKPASSDEDEEEYVYEDEPEDDSNTSGHTC